MVSIATPTSPLNEASRIKSAENRKGIRSLLSHALDLEQLTHELTLQLGEIDPTSEEAEQTRAQCQAAAAGTRAWDTIVERIRILRGEPMPGSLRPESKPKSRKSSSRPEPRLAPKVEVSTQPTAPANPDLPKPQ